MKRIILATVGVAVIAATAATVGFARPAASTEAASAQAASAAAALPPLPAEVRERKRWNIAVKCDSPPFGYIDVQGRHAGFDVEIARWFSRFAFGRSNRVSFTCITTPAREASLQTGRVDLVIATYTYTAARDNLIDFSRAYYKATGRLLVRNDSSIRSVGDLAGKTVATTRGSIYDRWVGNCFPQSKLLVTDGFTNALLAFRDGRADTLMWDDTVLLGIAVADPNLKLTDDLFLPLPYGIGMKQGNAAMKRWVDSRLNIMAKRDAFFPIMKASVPARNLAAFAKNILRPKQVFYYTRTDLTSKCS
ncbi:MAG: transporter substrate-binding domain-containing protein [Gaiellaceae bacterium]